MPSAASADGLPSLVPVTSSGRSGQNGCGQYFDMGKCTRQSRARITSAETSRESCFILRGKFTPIAADWELSLTTGEGVHRGLRNQSAFEHFVGNWSCHFVDEHNPHLRIGLQKLDRLLFLWRGRLWRSLLFLPKLFAGGTRVFRDDLGRDLVQNWVLILRVRSCCRGQRQGRNQ